jgi:hypothetical protein
MFNKKFLFVGIVAGVLTLSSVSVNATPEDVTLQGVWSCSPLRSVASMSFASIPAAAITSTVTSACNVSLLKRVVVRPLLDVPLLNSKEQAQ